MWRGHAAERWLLCSSLIPADEAAEGWLLGLALSYEERSGEQGWMAQGLIKSIDLLLPAPSLAARKDLIDGSCPSAQYAGGLVVRHDLQVSIRQEETGNRRGLVGRGGTGGYCCCRCRCPGDG